MKHAACRLVEGVVWVLVLVGLFAALGIVMLVGRKAGMRHG